MDKTTILLADDHAIVRQGLRALFEKEPDFAVVGEASNGLETLNLVDKLNPDVLVLDLVMPGLHGLEVVRQVARRSPNTRAIVLSMHANEPYVVNALKNNAFGYVLKDSSTQILVRAIRNALAGERYIPPPFSESAITAYLEKTGQVSVDAYETLSSRERQVLQLVAEGHTNAEAGRQLFISPRTVEVHRANLMKKLSLRNEADLIRYAFKKGILPLEESSKLSGPFTAFATPSPSSPSGKDAIAPKTTSSEQR